MSDPKALAEGMLAALDRPIGPEALQKRATEFDIDIHISELLGIIGEPIEQVIAARLRL